MVSLVETAPTPEQYEKFGYTLIPGAIPAEAIDGFMDKFSGLAVEVAHNPLLANPHSDETAVFWNSHKDVQATVYDRVRQPKWLTNFCSMPQITSRVRQVAGENLALLSKIVFRIDAPLETSQFAAWHQDYFYVRGNQQVVTAWIPMQDTEFVHGCLAVMPRSHALGPLPHDLKVIKKRDLPLRVYDREVRYVEMKKGDLLLFHSCLLHSSSLNLSAVTRYSIQARYTPAHLPTDPEMGGLVPV